MDNDTNLELQQLKSQMEILRAKLDRQQIVNDNLLRRSMTGKMSWIKKYVWFEIIITPFLLLFFFELHNGLGLSWWLYGFLAALLVVDVTMDWRINRYSPSRLMQGSLVEAAHHFTRMKRRRAVSMAVMLPLTIVWVVWFVFELLRVARDSGTAPDIARGFAYGALVGAIIGGIVGLIFAVYIFRKMQRTNDDILATLHELESN